MLPHVSRFSSSPSLRSRDRGPALSFINLCLLLLVTLVATSWLALGSAIPYDTPHWCGCGWPDKDDPRPHVVQVSAPGTVYWDGLPIDRDNLHGHMGALAKAPHGQLIIASTDSATFGDVIAVVDIARRLSIPFSIETIYRPDGSR